MTLNDKDITDAVSSVRLIDPFKAENVQNCRYYLRAGKVFLPETGKEEILESVVMTQNGVVKTCKSLHWCIEPSDTLVVMTEEVVKIPAHLYATYGPLNGLAQKGLLLVNASIIEPGYNGPLSCYFVNFSKKAIHIAPGDPIAKICFHKLTKQPHDLKPLVITRDAYAKSLSEAAFSYPESFLDIGNIEKRVADTVTKSVKTSIAWGGILIALLLLFNTFEPFITKFFWDRAGVVSTTSREEIQKIKSDLDAQQKELADERQRMELVDKERQEHYDKMVLELQAQMKNGNR